MRSALVATASPQGSRRIAECHKRRKSIYFNLRQMAKMMRSTGNLSLLFIGRMHGSGIWTALCISTSSTMRRNRGERYVNLLHIRSVDENKQAGPLWQRYREAKKELSNLHKSKRGEQVPCIQKCDRRRLKNRIGPSLHLKG